MKISKMGVGNIAYVAKSSVVSTSYENPEKSASLTLSNSVVRIGESLIASIVRWTKDDIVYITIQPNDNVAILCRDDRITEKTTAAAGDSDVAISDIFIGIGLLRCNIRTKSQNSVVNPRVILRFTKFSGDL